MTTVERDNGFIDPEHHLSRILPRRVDRLRFEGIRMLEFIGAYKDQPMNRRPLQFLIDHADPQTEIAQVLLDGAKQSVDLIDYLEERKVARSKE